MDAQGGLALHRGWWGYRSSIQGHECGSPEHRVPAHMCLRRPRGDLQRHGGASHSQDAS